MAKEITWYRVLCKHPGYNGRIGRIVFERGVSPWMASHEAARALKSHIAVPATSSPTAPYYQIADFYWPHVSSPMTELVCKNARRKFALPGGAVVRGLDAPPQSQPKPKATPKPKPAPPPSVPDASSEPPKPPKLGRDPVLSPKVFSTERSRLGASVSEMARIIGVTASKVRKWERDGVPEKMQEKVAKAIKRYKEQVND